MAKRQTMPTGPVCRWCLLPIKRHGTAQYNTFVHIGTGSIYCSDNLTGLTARHAEPR